MSGRSRPTPPEVGSIWIRRLDGVEVEVTAYESEWEDVNWRRVDNPSRSGDIYLSNFIRTYDPKET